MHGTTPPDSSRPGRPSSRLDISYKRLARSILGANIKQSSRGERYGQIKWKTRKGKKSFSSTLESRAHIPEIAFLTTSFLQGIAVRPRTSSYLLLALLEQKEMRERKQPIFRLQCSKALSFKYVIENELHRSALGGTDLRTNLVFCCVKAVLETMPVRKTRMEMF